jgi:hypothetical protein
MYAVETGLGGMIYVPSPYPNNLRGCNMVLLLGVTYEVRR